MTQDPRPITMEFHVSRAARERYGIDMPWFSLTGNVVLADPAATRRLAWRMNQARDSSRHPELTVPTGQLHALGLIDEILHYVAALYREQVSRDVVARAARHVESRLGAARFQALLHAFGDTFPPLAVHRGELGLDAYLAGSTAGVPHREPMLEELLMLALANTNPAFEPYRELFDDAPLAATGYAGAIEALREFFDREPGFGPDQEPLIRMLESPRIEAPHSLSGQLDYIRRRWGDLLGAFLDRLLTTLDVIREDERAERMRRGAAPGGDMRGQVATFGGHEQETERFTPDRDWMPQVVLMAKSAQVWLDQLARAYSQPVDRLDQIPEPELERLARWGINSLWLIGLWERSPASRRIKQLTGNPDADASAYSLLEYRIAGSLGGEAACDALSARLEHHGIRLASDMVPNHMGIDSRWVVEHPDWFLSLRDSPFPGYTFHGPDLSWDPNVTIQLEDHYYDRTDAAVVFRRAERGSGDVRYVYHGNDGTSMPWNDTAQLDYLQAEVRNAVIGTILEVARRFPVIRLDAAMTLAKKHYQRLWFPEPGGGGAIPSRAEHGLTRAEFDRAMPVEFWREVVDRVAKESPDTLLLAEAFWLMEGYFVRTLGMHRVYNSAFMNMLRDEDNANYRAVIRNTLEFDPEILKRYVNFMSNPDERTAVDQFGTGDKYFGVCTLMVTLPGLPMFGHGQFEGFTERYGMEFRRAGRDETPDLGLVARHEHEIVPLLHRRRVFAEAHAFQLYDFTTGGGVNEDVFAYSNRAGDERALVLYHNRFARTDGWIHGAVAVAEGRGDARVLRRRTLAHGLGLGRGSDRFCVFREQRSQLEFLRSTPELHDRGLHVVLEAYQCQVFLGFREELDVPGRPWARLAARLGGRGVPDMEEALAELQLEPLLGPFREWLNPHVLGRLVTAARRSADVSGAGRPAAPAATAGADGPAVPEAGGELVPTAAAAGAAAHAEGKPAPVAGLEGALRGELTGRWNVAATAVRDHGGGSGDLHALGEQTIDRLAAALALEPGPAPVDALLAGVMVAGLGRVADGRDGAAAARDRLVTWRWNRVVEDALHALGSSRADAGRRTAMIAAWLENAEPFRAVARGDLDLATLLDAWFTTDRVRRVLHVHDHAGIEWLSQEAWEEWLHTLAAAAASESRAVTPPSAARTTAECRNIEELVDRLVRAGRDAGFRVDGIRASAAQAPVSRKP